jgi:hypothetical protein
VDRYSAAARNIAGADINEPLFGLWNPHASIPLYVVRIMLTKTGATGGIELGAQRISTRGTAANTNTPDIDNHHNLRYAPASGALLDQGNYSVAPTLEGPNLLKAISGVQGGSAVEYDVPDPGIEVPAGTGLAVVALVANTQITDVTWVWDE